MEELFRMAHTAIYLRPKIIMIDKIDELIIEAQKSIKDIKRVSIDSAWKLIQLASANLIQNVELTHGNLPGLDKKQLVLRYLDTFYDSVFSIVDVPFVPQLVEPILHKYIKKILMMMASSSIDATVTIFRSTGVFKKKES